MWVRRVALKEGTQNWIIRRGEGGGGAGVVTEIWGTDDEAGAGTETGRGGIDTDIVTATRLVVIGAMGQDLGRDICDTHHDREVLGGGEMMIDIQGHVETGAVRLTTGQDTIEIGIMTGEDEGGLRCATTLTAIAWNPLASVRVKMKRVTDLQQETVYVQ